MRSMKELMHGGEVIKHEDTYIFKTEHVTPQGATYDQYLPENPLGDTFIIDLGFGEGRDSYRKGGIFLASQGLHVVVVDRPRYGFSKVDFELAGIPKESVRGGLILESVKKDLLKQNPTVDQFDIFGTSQGGISLAVNKLLFPGTVGKTIYNSPVHFLTEDFTHLSKNFLVMAKDEIANRIATKDLEGFLRDTRNTISYWKNPIRSIFEAKDVAKTNFSTMPELFCGSTVIITKHDQISEYKVLRRILQDLGIENVYELDGGHGGLFDRTYWDIILETVHGGVEEFDEPIPIPIFSADIVDRAHETVLQELLP